MAPASSPQALVDAVIDRTIDEKRIVGAEILIAQDGAIVYRRAAGFADREEGRPLGEGAIFRLASITKPIVAAATMRLVEQGAMSLDDPITRWLPEFRPRLPNGEAPTIRVHHLLTHTAGLSYRFREPQDSPYHRLNVSDGLDQPGLSIEENLRRLAAAPLLSAPGATWRYSLGMDVLGAAAAKAAKASLPELVREFVLDPLGMKDTGFSVRDPSRLVTPYADGAPAPVRMTENMAVPITNIPDLPAGAAIRFAPSRVFDAASYLSGGAGLAGTAADFLRFLEAIRLGGAPILQPATVAQMTSDQVGAQAQTRGPGWGFGYGWAVLANPGLSGAPQGPGTLQWGGVYGHSWLVDPTKALSVVAFTNTALEGMNGRFVVDLHNAIYGA
jgi:CubicO group peptidase (beta-lactamase class C family)